MNSAVVRELTLAHAAIKHALYFLEIDADGRAASYCNYAADHLKSFATGLSADPLSGQPYDLEDSCESTAIQRFQNN